MSNAVELSPDLLTALLLLEAITDVRTVKMLERGVPGPLALKEPSDFKEALPLKDVWRSAMPMSGAQCVMMDGIPPMPK